MVINKLRFILLFLFCFSVGSHTSQASEALFGYIYTTDLLPKGHFEIEQWFTDREGQAQGHFHHLDMSTELEYGVSDNFQVSMYLDYMYANESANSVQGKTEGIEIPFDHDSSTPYSQFRVDGVSFEAVYRFLSPYLDPIGLAVYAEPEFGAYSKGLELRAIVQKNFLDDQLTLAGNFWVEYEREDGSNLVTPGSGDIPDGVPSNATYAEFDLGASYRVAAEWSVGLEFREHNEFAGLSLNRTDQDHAALFLGPNIHYASEHFFVTFSMLRQIAAYAYTEEQLAQVAYGRLYGDEHTTWDGIRLKVGFPL